ncbi:MAG TPA: tetratricopeptide repeat protein [Pyrinomonadaceae bacterium]|nr:tetratricopeptide repeat protein [Pyrinomonadaceae bacterium]
MKHVRNFLASLLVALVVAAGLMFEASAAVRPLRQPQQQPAASAAAAATSSSAPQSDTARGLALYKQGKHKEAIAVLRAVVKQTPADDAAWHSLGQALHGAGDKGDAVKAYEKAVKLRPDNVLYRTSWALALITAGKTANARKEAEAALKLDARNSVAHYIIGLASLASASFDEAAREADAVIKLEPNFAAAHLLKGDALIDSFAQKYAALPSDGKSARTTLYPLLDQAAQSIENYLRLNPNDAEAELRRAQVAALRAFTGTQTDPARPVYREEDTDTPVRITDYALPTGIARTISSGRVMMLVTLDADGTVKSVVPLRASDPRLVRPYREAMHKMKFVAAQKGGRAVSQIRLMDLSFGTFVELRQVTVRP